MRLTSTIAHTPVVRLLPASQKAVFRSCSDSKSKSSGKTRKASRNNRSIATSLLETRWTSVDSVCQRIRRVLAQPPLLEAERELQLFAVAYACLIACAIPTLPHKSIEHSYNRDNQHLEGPLNPKDGYPLLTQRLHHRPSRMQDKRWQLRRNLGACRTLPLQPIFRVEQGVETLGKTATLRLFVA